MYLYYFLVLILTTQKPIFCEVRVIAFKLIFILCEPYFAGSQVQFLFGQLDQTLHCYRTYKILVYNAQQCDLCSCK